MLAELEEWKNEQIEWFNELFNDKYVVFSKDNEVCIETKGKVVGSMQWEEEMYWYVKKIESQGSYHTYSERNEQLICYWAVVRSNKNYYVFSFMIEEGQFSQEIYKDKQKGERVMCSYEALPDEIKQVFQRAKEYVVNHSRDRLRFAFVPTNTAEE